MSALSVDKNRLIEEAREELFQKRSGGYGIGRTTVLIAALLERIDELEAAAVARDDGAGGEK